MISLRRAIENEGETQSRLRVSLAAYGEVLAALQRAAAVLADDSQPFQQGLSGVILQLDQKAAIPVIEQSGKQVAANLDEFARELAQNMDGKEREYKEIIRLVAETGVTLAQNGSTQGEELTQAASKIDSIARLEDVAAMRRQLTTQTAELKRLAARVQSDGAAQARALEQEMRSIQERLKVAETLAETDALTGLGNRRRAELKLQSAIASGLPLSILVFDLNGFKDVNDRYGHIQGDHLLKAVAGQIKKCVRANDEVCRWGGDEFIVLLVNTPLAAAQDRAARVQNDAFGQFVLGKDAQSVRVTITGSVGIAQYQPGETATEFFERADQLLCQRKAQRKARTPQVAPAF